ncbi:hypothetical protein L3X38_003292 [Prunus dulcis]|uniref:Uncharacterized protein n=1 Tax=Prunus dulcis TaxID=3755 RepID=A0AAD5F1N1_PRUDU|nr:hypothetical protein L3X38_003292 [Prunus dulcis]
MWWWRWIRIIPILGNLIVEGLFGRVNLERSVESSAGKNVRTFSSGRTYRRQRGRSIRQASDTGVVPAEGSPMLKSAIIGSAIGGFGRWLPFWKSVFLRQGRMRVYLGASRFDAGYARLIMV